MKRVRTLVFTTCLCSMMGLMAPVWSQEPDGSFNEANALISKGMELYKAGRYQEALPLCERTLQILEKTLGPEHPTTANITGILAGLHYKMGAYDKALPLYEVALKTHEKAFGPDHIQTATILNILAQLHTDMGSYDKALPLCERALTIREKSLSPEHPDTAQSLNNLARLYYSMGLYDKALPLYERILQINEKAHGKEAPDTATSLNNLAELYRATGAYDKALPLCERALTIREKSLSPEHPLIATSLNNLAELHRAMGFYDKALPLYEQALSMSEKRLGPAHPNTAVSLNNLAELYRAMGSYDKALPLCERALKIKDKALGPDHPETSKSIASLALLRLELGFYDKALPLFERALSINEKALGQEHPNTASCLDNLAVLYRAMGRYDKALPLFERALRIRDKILGSEHPDTAQGLSNLAKIYEAVGNYDKALLLCERALTIYEKVFGPEHPATADSLNNLAMTYGAVGRFDKALSLCERAFKIREKSLGPEHPATKTSLSNLGILYLRTKNYQRAQEFCAKSMNKRAMVSVYLVTGKNHEALKLLGDIQPAVTDVPLRWILFHTQEGYALSGTGSPIEAMQSFLKAVQGIEELRTRVAGERGGFFQAGFAGGYILAYHGLVSALAESSRCGDELPDNFSTYGDNPAEAGFYFAEATKARSLLEAMAEAARKKSRVAIPENLKESEESLLQQLAALNQQWEKALKGGKEALEEVQFRKERLTSELDRLIVELRQSYPFYAALHHPRPVPAKELPLNSKEVLLEYAVGYKTSNLFLVRKGGVEKVIDIPLGKEAIEEKIKTFMEAFLSNRGKGFSTTHAKELYDLLLGNALSGVGATDEVIIIPDGILGLLPFEALVEKEGSGPHDAVYVGDRYSIRYYQSAAVLALQRTLKDQEASKPLFALGNPVFNATDERCAASKPKKKSKGTTAKQETQIAFRALATRVEWGKTAAGDKDGTELVYLPLPETETEVRSIAQLMGVAAKPPDVLLNLDAREEGLRKTSLKDYRYVHFATHADLPGKVQGVNEPFILLGQVGNRGDDNGFLTMSKVLGLELRADMVVLSACLTGRGKVMEGEGVVNFARAFQHAGAKSVVVSLWEVASQATVEYMERFYGHLKAGKTRTEALRQARSEMKAQYPNPFLWAPFILHGEG